MKKTEVRDTSPVCPYGGGGIVHDARIQARENGDELPSGVNAGSCLHPRAKTCKIHVGDKMASRHGNKGVVSNIVPGGRYALFTRWCTPIDIMLNHLVSFPREYRRLVSPLWVWLPYIRYMIFDCSVLTVRVMDILTASEAGNG